MVKLMYTEPMFIGVPTITNLVITTMEKMENMKKNGILKPKLMIYGTKYQKLNRFYPMEKYSTLLFSKFSVILIKIKMKFLNFLK